eukprot:TRINITY_DN31026_c0_g1_i1.p1 TRINITY_DN31026_c0_g1~~TRINITY_DN31026_c0_g1_i1.p1  ORF type:complete len:323 (+),score=46.04 TRINITY_DN31026_c0_g1_i1:195-1163(+)
MDPQLRFNRRLPGKPDSVNASFQDCIIIFARNLEKKLVVSEELQDIFLSYAQNSAVLPEHFDTKTVDAFISILLAYISIPHSYEAAVRGLKLLLKYLKGDDKVFSRFSPNKEALNRLGLDKYFTQDEEVAFDFACFLLRYYKDIEYSDLCATPRMVQKVKKAELQRTWVDIDNLAVNQEQIIKVAQENQDLTSRAFAELYAHVDELKRSFASSIVEMSNKMSHNTLPPVVETGSAKAIEGISGVLETVVNQVSSLEAKAEEMQKKLDTLEVLYQEAEGQNSEAARLLKSDIAYQKETRLMTLSRLAKVEHDVSAMNSPCTLR